jgi:hypothetical protein
VLSRTVLPLQFYGDQLAAILQLQGHGKGLQLQLGILTTRAPGLVPLVTADRRCGGHVEQNTLKRRSERSTPSVSVRVGLSGWMTDDGRAVVLRDTGHSPCGSRPPK